MKNTLNIAIVTGGDSSEANISFESARQIAGWLDPKRFTPYTVTISGCKWVADSHNQKIPIDKNDFSIIIEGRKILFDCALIAIHGTPGENGLLQGYFEMIGIPYTTGGVFNAAATFNKHFCKELVRQTGVKLAKGITLRKGESYSTKQLVNRLGLPLFVKPNEGGSSYGISRVEHEADLHRAISKAFEEDSTILIEELISGREFTCGVFKSAQKSLLMPITEIIPEGKFFDYDAKYNNRSREITPAEIPQTLTNAIHNISSKIYDHLECKGVVRIDYIVRDEQIYFLEINVVPGMSRASIVPQQVKAMGTTMSELFTMIIDDALTRHANR